MPPRPHDDLVSLDQAHVWHPYTSLRTAMPPLLVERAEGCRLYLADGRVVIDGMSSWWSAIHGYNVPELNAALDRQTERMAHVMFGGLTHEPAVRLAERLVDLTPPPLVRVFFSDSGSVAVEVALKMALQYWTARGEARKRRFIALRGGYHGDTFLAMSVCDPAGGMHAHFRGVVPEQIFVGAPGPAFGDPWDDRHFDEMAAAVRAHQDEVAAIILEPIVQNTGGMRFYSPEYLRKLRSLASELGVLLIFDEIATGFGRTGKLFAAEHAGVSPDILCLGKALTGGYVTLAATLCTEEVAGTITTGEPGVLMHGPTFMANPLACAVALASIDLLMASPWQERVARIEAALRADLDPARAHPAVADVRALGAIGVIELRAPVDLEKLQPRLLERGVWLRPFGRFLYTMPPFTMEPEDVRAVTEAMIDVLGAVGPASREPDVLSSRR